MFLFKLNASYNKTKSHQPRKELVEMGSSHSNGRRMWEGREEPEYIGFMYEIVSVTELIYFKRLPLNYMYLESVTKNAN